MQFEELLKQFLKENKKEDLPSSWVIEITKDPQKSKKYNLIGELIILLAQLRNRLD